MEANIVTEHALVRERPDGASAVVAELRHGDRVRLGEATFRRAWIEVRLADGRTGHIRGETTARTEPMSQAVVVGTPMAVRFVRDLGTDPDVVVPEGQIIATGGSSNAQYMSWTEVALPGGVHGYVEGEPHAQRIVWSQVAQGSVTIRNAPNLSGAEVRTISSGSIIGIGPVANFAQHPWLRAILPDRTEGFIPPDTNITRLDAAIRLRRLLTFPGRCASCRRSGDVKMANLHLVENAGRRFIGDCFVPICSPCVDRKFSRNMVALFLAGSASLVATALTGYELLGAIGFVPFGFYSMNAAQNGATFRRYRRIASKGLVAELAGRDVDSADLSFEQEADLDEIWYGLTKWIVCPGCLTMHTQQDPWCPQCQYLFPWRFGPRP